MRALKPLVRLLQRSLRTLLLRRGIAWMACTLILLVLGNALAQLFEPARVLRTGLVMASLSALPAFLFWPIPERFLLERLRRLDEETVFEAFLEAEPGQARDLLSRLAGEKASALPFLRLPREPLWAGLGPLCAAAVACLVLAEAGSFLVLGHSLVLAPARATTEGSGARIEETGYSEFATEDPAARRERRDRRLDPAENPELGGSGDSQGRVGASDRSPNLGADSPGLGGSPSGEAIAKRRHGERDEVGGIGGSSASTAPEGSPRPGDPGSGGTRDQAGPVARDKAGPAPTASTPVPGLTGQGYEHTTDTRVPSPLLDYRSRFEARYAERTGIRISASGRMGFGELRDFQRRYFDSFTLKADVGAAEDPYDLLLKRRWSDVKGGAW